MVKHFRVPGGLRTRLEESGVQLSAVLRRAGLPQDLFDQTRILVTTEELFALWRAIVEVSGDHAIGVKLGTETKIERIHPSGIAALSTENFGAAVEHLGRYKKLSVPEEIVHEKDDDEWSIQFRWTLAVEAEPPVLIEHCFAWVLTIARYGSGTRISPLRVELMQPALACEGTRAALWMPGHLRCAAQCDRLPHLRRCSSFCDPQCRATRHAGPAVRRGPEVSIPAARTASSNSCAVRFSRG
jgi:hypothetical protein